MTFHARIGARTSLRLTSHRIPPDRHIFGSFHPALPCDFRPLTTASVPLFQLCIALDIPGIYAQFVCVQYFEYWAVQRIAEVAGSILRRCILQTADFVPHISRHTISACAIFTPFITHAYTRRRKQQRIDLQIILEAAIFDITHLDRATAVVFSLFLPHQTRPFFLYSFLAPPPPVSLNVLHRSRACHPAISTSLLPLPGLFSPGHR